MALILQSENHDVWCDKMTIFNTIQIQKTNSKTAILFVSRINVRKVTSDLCGATRRHFDLQKQLLLLLLERKRSLHQNSFIAKAKATSSKWGKKCLFFLGVLGGFAISINLFKCNSSKCTSNYGDGNAASFWIRKNSNNWLFKQLTPSNVFAFLKISMNMYQHHF